MNKKVVGILIGMLMTTTVITATGLSVNQLQSNSFVFDDITEQMNYNENGPPTAPIITGPTYGNIGIEYEWTFVSTDPDGDNITYYVHWGESCGCEEWHGPVSSGTEVVVNHTYGVKNTFTITSFAIDENFATSPQSYLEIIMPKNKFFTNTFLQRLFERFPNAFPILRQLLNLN